MEVVNEVSDAEKVVWRLDWVEINPDGVVGSAYSEPTVWKVSRQRPIFGRFTGWC
jgi:hypothetical protein